MIASLLRDYCWFPLHRDRDTTAPADAVVFAGVHIYIATATRLRRQHQIPPVRKLYWPWPFLLDCTTGSRVVKIRAKTVFLLPVPDFTTRASDAGRTPARAPTRAALVGQPWFLRETPLLPRAPAACLMLLRPCLDRAGSAAAPPPVDAPAGMPL